MPTDKERLDWLEKMGDHQWWVARKSTTGRGYRLHTTSGLPAFANIRDAIDYAMQNSDDA